MRRALDEREKEFKKQFELKVKDQFHFMNVELAKVKQIFVELDNVYQNINRFKLNLNRFDDFTVVGSCQKIRMFEKQYQIMFAKIILPNPVEKFKAAATTGSPMQKLPVFKLNADAVRIFIE